MQKRENATSRPLLFLHLWPLALLVGLVGGLGAVVFRGLIAFFHNLLFLGKVSLAYDANVHTPAGPWGPLVIMVPILGAAGVAFLVTHFAPEAKGHGVPEVMEAVYYNRGIIRPIVALIKALASALSIGSGGSIGREGPIVQIGSSFGSTVGQVLKVKTGERTTLIAAGAAAGIAATFNTPIGGILFAVELILPEVSVRTLVPVAISAAVATYVGRIFFGVHPSFVIPSFEVPYFVVTRPLLLVAYAGLGLLLGLASMLYIRSIYGLEDFFDRRIKGSYYRRHMLGMLVQGVMMYLLLITAGHYYVEGVGYATVQDILSGVPLPVYLLLLLFALKLLATSLTLGSGASGGIFSPSLFMGATLGGTYGMLLSLLLPALATGAPPFAVAGMAGMIAGTTDAALTAVVMTFEMTLDYNVILPMIITVAFSYGIRKVLLQESIYSMKLTRRGRFLPEAMRSDLAQIKRARQMMDRRFLVVSGNARLDEFAHMLDQHPEVPWLVVADGERVLGVVAHDAAMCTIVEPGTAVTAADVADRNYAVVEEQMTLFTIVDRLRGSGARVALVVPPPGDVSTSVIKGVITDRRIAQTLEDDIDLFE